MSDPTLPADWIAVDWGTSRMRAWAFGPDGAEIGHAVSDAGMGGLAPEGFEPALLAAVSPWLGPDRATPVIACGMVGARQGWVEAPYVSVPCPPPGPAQAVMAPVRDPRLAVTILPGVSQAAPADVMRGEETQIAGFLASTPGFDGTLCLPGTHTKWVQVSAGEIVSFRTAMTGELFAALRGHTVLRHALGAAEGGPAFLEAVADAMARPEALTQRLFSLRAESLLSGLAPAAAADRASGLLIGLELAGARGYWLGTRFALIGNGAQSELYAAALAAQGVIVERADADAMVLAGLGAAWAALEGERP
ncbi:MAG: 2-dehydro-3-deoxygalactonokinase [Maritimibacter sp.]|nr:2-dehydro-3-deoxygalactonokinase [Maritimibacter sp.]